MKEWQMRTAMLVGEDSLGILAHSKIAVFGLGGVGSYAVEALARAGVGEMLLVDNDEFSASNINRQLYALPKTVGAEKCEAAAARVSEINPECVVFPKKEFLTPENISTFQLENYDYVLDCIDNVPAKVALAALCEAKKIRLISAMGAGNKLHPEMFEIADITKTSVCPLAKVMRRELKLRGVKHLKVVYSRELPVKSHNDGYVPSSISFVPSAVGLIMAGEAVRELIGK